MRPAPGLMGVEWPDSGHSGAMSAFMGPGWPVFGHSRAMRVAQAHGLLLGLLLLAGCAPPAWAPTVEADEAGIAVTSTLPIQRVEVLDAEGIPVLRRDLPAPVLDPRVEVPLQPDTDHVVVLHTGDRREELSLRTPPPPGPLRIQVEAPLGQGLRPIAPGDVVRFDTIEGIGSRVALRLTAREPLRVDVRLCGTRRSLDLAVPGEQAEVVVVAPSADCEGEVLLSDGRRTAFVLRPVSTGLEQAREALRLERITFPADEQGRADAGRAPGRVTLPSPFWDAVLRRSRFGARSWAAEIPWAWTAVSVRNDGDRPINAVVRLRVTDADGAPVAAFRSRVRSSDGDTGLVTGLLRVPAGDSSVARLPLYVDPTGLPGRASAWTRTVELTPLGTDAPLLVDTQPLYVQRGSTATSLGFAAVLLSMFAGLVLLALRLRPWLRATSTSELVTIALFANLMFFFSAASHLVGLGAATVLGPFSSLVTGLLDDAFRFALLATLVTLLPRPGVVTLAILVHYLMRALALGGFQVTDPVLLASAVLWLEGGLWLCGITRSGAWRDESALRRFARMATAFGVASVVSVAVGLVVAAVLYRLYFAGWYVALLLVVPGLLYTVVACWLATGFAASLRRVEG